MRTNTIAVTVLAATATLAAAVPERPKIYFPRHVKRFVNSTTSDTAAITSSTTKRDPLGGLISSILPNVGEPLRASSTASLTTTLTSSQDGPLIPTSSLDQNLFPTAGSTTSSPTPDSTSATGGPSSDAQSTASASAAATSTSTDGFLGGLTSLLGNLNPTSTTVSATETSTPDVSASATDARTTTTAAPLIPTDLFPSVVPSDTTTMDSATITATPTSASESDLLGGITSFLGTGTSIPPMTTTSASAEETGSPESLLPSSTLGDLMPTSSLLNNNTDSITIPPPESTSSWVPTGSITATISEPTDSVSVTAQDPTSTGSAVTAQDPTSTGSGLITAPPTTTPTPSDAPVNNATSSTDVPTLTDLPIPTNLTSSIPTASVLPGTTSDLVPGNSTVPFSPSTIAPSTTEPASLVPSTDATTSATAPVNSVAVTGTMTDTATWLPSTIFKQPTATQNPSDTGSVSQPTAMPSSQPKAITSDNPPDQPPGTTLIQLAFTKGENYDFILKEARAAAQIFQYIPKALSYAGGYDVSKAVMMSIVPYDTLKELGYVTSLAMVYVPSESVEQLRLDHKIAASAFYNNPDGLVFDMTAQINNAIDITVGSRLPGDTSSGPGGIATNKPNSQDPFGNSNQGDESTSAQQKGTTAAIAVGIAGVASAYGAAMFLIARRYKRRRQRHQRASSLTSPSEMRQRGSPALMGGALLSRDFSAGANGGAGNYGGVAAPPATRNSQGSGRSGMNNSGRTAYISAPVAAENSLGWN